MASDQIKTICSNLLTMFERGNFPPAAARTVIARITGSEIPSSKWSFCNQLIMFMSESVDCRGFRQWREVGRSVTKGAKAVYILVPLTRKTRMVVTNDETRESREETRQLITGFKTCPVFRYEDTEGKPLTEQNYKPPELPPLYHVAEHFGMVRYYPICGGALGSCSQSGTITLYSHDVDVFLHELGHLVHGTIKQLKPGQNSKQELVAEMVSVVLMEMMSITGYQWRGWKYMQSYADEDPVKTLRAIGAILNDVEAVINRILTVDADIRSAEASIA